MRIVYDLDISHGRTETTKGDSNHSGDIALVPGADDSKMFARHGSSFEKLIAIIHSGRRLPS